MKRELKRQFYLRRDELALILAMESVFFLLGEILLGFVVYGLGEKESIIPLGTILTERAILDEITSVHTAVSGDGQSAHVL